MLVSFGMNEWLLTICLIVLFVLGLRRILETNAERSYLRLKELLEVTEKKRVKDETLETNVFSRTYKLIEDSIQNFVSNQVKKGNLSNLDLRIQQAGLDVTTNHIWTKSIIYGLIGSFVGIALRIPSFVLIFGAIAFYIPFYLLKDKIDRRQFDLLNKLPDFLDLVAVTFPASSNIEQTFETVCDKFDNEISKEFQIAVNEIKTGRNKRVVYQELVMRTGLNEIAVLISQINQAETFGTGLEDVLVSQSKSIRHAKKVKAEQRGSRAKLMMYGPGLIMLVISMGILVFPFAVPIMESFGSGMM